jgi:hypothetical protein
MWTRCETLECVCVLADIPSPLGKIPVRLVKRESTKRILEVPLVRSVHAALPHMSSHTMSNTIAVDLTTNPSASVTLKRSGVFLLLNFLMEQPHSANANLDGSSRWEETPVRFVPKVSSKRRLASPTNAQNAQSILTLSFQTEAIPEKERPAHIRPGPPRRRDAHVISKE